MVSNKIYHHRLVDLLDTENVLEVKHHFLLIFLQYLISDTLGCRLVFICHKYLQCICCDLQKTSRAKWPGSPGVSPLSLGRHRTSVRTTLVTLQNHPRVCGAVLWCAIISLSNFLFSIAWLIWLQRLGHNYSTFYSHSVFHQSYFLENFDSGTIIIFGILWRTTWTRLISLCIYISTAILSIRMLKVRMEIFRWRYPQSGSNGRCGSVKATTAERWRRVCMQTHFHMDMVKPVQPWTSESENKQPHGNKYINICILLV